MSTSVERAVAEIRKGRRRPVYLLHGDELLAKEGAKAIVAALVPPGEESLSVETLAEDQEIASLPGRLRTVSLFGGTKVVVVHDSKAFVSKQAAGSLARRSRELWQGGDAERALRLFLQLVAAAGEDAAFLDRAAQGGLSEAAWDRLLDMEREPEAEQWLQEIASRALADQLEIPEAGGAGVARIYEEVIQGGIPPDTVLVLTAEVVDERRALFKKIGAAGCVIDCGIRSRRAWETQMDPDAARARIQEKVRGAGKSIDGEAVRSIVERTGASMRGLESELEKLLCYVGSRPAVTRADVLEVLSSSREANIFDLTNAVGDRDAGRAVRALRSLLTQREPPPRILNTVAGELRTLILARSVLEGWPAGLFDAAMPFPAFQARVAPKLKELGKGPEAEGPTAALAGMHPFRAYALLKSAWRFSLPELTGALTALHEADLALKTSGRPDGLILEQLLLHLCGPAPPPVPPGAGTRRGESSGAVR